MTYVYLRELGDARYEGETDMCIGSLENCEDLTINGSTLFMLMSTPSMLKWVIILIDKDGDSVA